MRNRTLAFLAIALSFTLGACDRNAEQPQADAPAPAKQAPADAPVPAEQPQADAPAPAEQAPADDHDVLYAAGAVLGQNIQSWNLKPEELTALLQGMQDSASGKKLAVNVDELRPKIQELAKSRAASAATAERKASEPFLQKAAAEKGAKKTESGLVIQTVKAGSGASPKADDKVKVHYHGTLTDGTVFDSSVDRGEPVSFPLRGVIPCWTEGLQLMKVGEKAKLVCPSEIAYSDRGAPPKIKPGATLVFDVELLEIEAPDKAAEPVKPAPK